MDDIKKIRHAPIRNVEYEKKIQNAISQINDCEELAFEVKDLAIKSLGKQIMQRLIRIENGNIVRYKCPTCGNLFWMKSMLSCEYCGQMLIYGNGDDRV